MNARLFPGTAALALVLAMSAAAVAVQDAQEGDGRFDLLFKGGSLTQYVAALENAAGDVNILVAEEARDMKIPALTLHSVNLQSAVHLLHSVTNPTDGGRVRKLKIDQIHIGGGRPNSIYTITSSHQFMDPPEQQHTTVLSIARLTARGMDPADLLTAVETTLELAAPDAPAVTLKFHEATSLLIIRGSAAQIGAIREVVEQAGESLKFKVSLREQQDQAAALAMAQDEAAVLRAQLKQARAEITEQQQRIIVLQERTADVIR